MRIAVFGLGEAGSLLSAGLARVGAVVIGYDPADVATPGGVARATDPREAARGARVVMAITAASDARTAMTQAWDVIEASTIYADLATASPTLQEDLARIAASKGVPFADVALMAPVPGRGLATPALASGPGAADLADLLNPLGANLEVIGDTPGRASGRKLLRSIVTKGLTALTLEAAQAAVAREDADWLWAHLAETVSAMDAEFLERMVSGTSRHVARRLEEMRAAEELLREIGVPSEMTQGTIAHLSRVATEGAPTTVSRRGEEGPP